MNGKWLLLFVFLLAGCSSGHWERYTTELPCPDCGGKGWDYDYERAWIGADRLMVVRECDNCAGNGFAQPWRWVTNAESTDDSWSWDRFYTGLGIGFIGTAAIFNLIQGVFLPRLVRRIIQNELSDKRS